MKNYYTNSITYGLLSIIANSFNNLVKQSLFIQFFFRNLNEYIVFENSYFYKIAILPIKLLKNISNGIQKHLKESFILNILNKFILSRLEVMIFLTVFLVPFIPTKVLLGIISLNVVLFLVKRMYDNNFKLVCTPMDIFMILFSMTVVYSGLTSFTVKSSLSIGILYILFILFYFVAENTIKSYDSIYYAFVFMVFAGFLVSLYGIYQHFTLADTVQAWVDTEMFEDIKSRVYSTLDNPNVLGEYLVLLIPMSIALFWESKKNSQRLIFIVTTITMIVCLVFTYSRGAWLGLMLALFIFVVFLDKRLILLGVVALLIMPFVLPPSIINRFASIGNIQDSSSAYRISIWLGSLGIVKDYWISGIGMGTEVFKMIYSRYALSAAYALHSHNLYIQLLIEFGIVGFSLFILMIGVFYKKLIISYKKKSKFISTFMIALCSGLGGYLLQGLVDNIWYNYKVVFTFWIIITFGMVCYNLINQDLGRISYDKCDSCN
ncbi:O-antigen ligase family protein [Tepidibacter thalassicus]|uniref:O-antigen ligase n=1 Tax=Tepidibacter thalassicus DSM 15285 TaxID=1123350 RepID=A0A1M5TCT1_9FIRM|nr:O-antigen ligase family protein [Tepidibacter thalassicus]SHH48496.1 O-antigen ligase [Tepidibacter thalassicus DSM 15285]